MRKNRTMPNPRKSSVIQERVGALMAEFGYYISPGEADRSQPIERLESQPPHILLNWPRAEKDDHYLKVALPVG